mgnify:FL=1
MKEILLKYKTIIFRTVGAFMLLVGFVIYFWSTPEEAITKNEIAAANVARMEASVVGGSSTGSKAPRSEASKFVEEFKNAQKKQLEYFTLMMMAFGALFLLYSFISKPKNGSDR